MTDSVETCWRLFNSVHSYYTAFTRLSCIIPSNKHRFIIFSFITYFRKNQTRIKAAKAICEWTPKIYDLQWVPNQNHRIYYIKFFQREDLDMVLVNSYPSTVKKSKRQPSLKRTWTDRHAGCFFFSFFLSSSPSFYIN